MTTVHLTEENLDVTIEEIVTSGEIAVDQLDVDICEYSTSVTRCPDALDISIVEESLDVDIVEDVLSVEFNECILTHEVSATSGKIKRDFDFSDFNGSELSIGNVPAGADIEYTVIEILELFDGDLQLSVGTITAQAILMRFDENSPDVVNRYAIFNNLEVTGTENFRLFFIKNGAVTQGRGRVTIYHC